MFITSVITCLFIVVPASAEIEYNLLEPEVVDDQEQYSSFIPYAVNLVNTILVLAVLLSIIVFAYGGIRYMFSSVPGVKTEASEQLKSAIGGLLIALSAWLILWTINPELVEFNLSLDQTGTPRTRAPGSPPINTDRPGANYTERLEGEGQYGPVPDNEFAVRDELKGEGFVINDDDVCKEEDVRNCRTYVGDLTGDTKQGTIDLMDDCKANGSYDCDMRISGAAEKGNSHSPNSAHYDGRAVDISYKETDRRYFEDLLSSDFNPPTPSSYGDVYTPKDPNSNIKKIIKEGDHYHIEFNQ